MPITHAAKKALRKDAKRRLQNEAAKLRVKKTLKQLRDALAQKRGEEAQRLLPQLFKALDKAAKIGVLKPNAAARKKSRIAKLLKRTA